MGKHSDKAGATSGRSREERKPLAKPEQGAD